MTIPSIGGAFVVLATLAGPAWAGEAAAQVKEKALAAPNGVPSRCGMDSCRIHGGRAAAVRLLLQVQPREGAKKMTGAPVELDKKLGRGDRLPSAAGEFVGDKGKPAVIPPRDAIKAKRSSWSGWGTRTPFPEGPGGVAGIPAGRRPGWASPGAYAPLIRDQGNSKIGTGTWPGGSCGVSSWPSDTEKTSQKEGWRKRYARTVGTRGGRPRSSTTRRGVQKRDRGGRGRGRQAPSTPYAAASIGPVPRLGTTLFLAGRTTDGRRQPRR